MQLLVDAITSGASGSITSRQMLPEQFYRSTASLAQVFWLLASCM
jgi:hypothetical protein